MSLPNNIFAFDSFSSSFKSSLEDIIFWVKTKCCCKELLSKVRILAKMHFKVFLSFFLKTADVRWPY